MPQPDSEDFRTICPTGSVPEGLVVPHYLPDRKLRVALARVGGRFYAFDDLCPCAKPACPLSAGLLSSTIIMCQCHGSRFDINNGAVIDGPAINPLQTHEIQILDGAIQIRLNPIERRLSDSE